MFIFITVLNICMSILQARSQGRTLLSSQFDSKYLNMIGANCFRLIAEFPCFIVANTRSLFDSSLSDRAGVGSSCNVSEFESRNRQCSMVSYHCWFALVVTSINSLDSVPVSELFVVNIINKNRMLLVWSRMKFFASA